MSEAFVGRTSSEFRALTPSCSYPSHLGYFERSFPVITFAGSVTDNELKVRSEGNFFPGPATNMDRVVGPPPGHPEYL